MDPKIADSRLTAPARLEWPGPAGTWAILFGIGALLTFAGIGREGLWYDESYTAAMTTHRFADIIRMSAADVHPPLYYLAARLGRFVAGGSEAALRALSALGLLALAGLGWGPVRRSCGDRCALLFTGLVFVTPINIAVAQDARMYTWACFLVTAAALHGYLAITGNARRDWALLTAYAVLGSYTHVYAILSIAILLLILFGRVRHKGRRTAKPLLRSASLVALAFLPWLWTMVRQALRVSRDFWIPAPDAHLLKEFLIFPFAGKFAAIAWLPGMLVNMTVWVLLAGLAAHRAIRDRDRAAGPVLLSGTLLLALVAVTLVASFVITPIFFARYFYTAMGLAMLVVAYGLAALPAKSLRVAAVCVLILAALPQLLYTWTGGINGPMPEARAELSARVQPDDVFVHGDEQTFGTFAWYFPANRHYLYLPDGFEGYSTYEAFSPTGAWGHDIASFVAGRPVVWLVNRTEMRYVGFETVPDEALTRTGLRRVTADEAFETPVSWYKFNVSRFER